MPLDAMSDHDDEDLLARYARGDAEAARVGFDHGEADPVERELYDEALTSLKLLTRSLEDYREAAPVSAFTSAGCA